MSSYTRLRYHLVFSTKNRQPFITPDIENLVYTALRRRAEDKGAAILIMNGVADHIHIVVAIPPTIAFADFMREIKTASTLSIRKMVPSLRLIFEWQDGYGAFTIDPENMQGVIAYVRNQKEHHAHHTLIERWEKSTEG